MFDYKTYVMQKYSPPWISKFLNLFRNNISYDLIILVYSFTFSSICLINNRSIILMVHSRNIHVYCPEVLLLILLLTATRFAKSNLAIY